MRLSQADPIYFLPEIDNVITLSVVINIPANLLSNIENDITFSEVINIPAN